MGKLWPENLGQVTTVSAYQNVNHIQSLFSVYLQSHILIILYLYLFVYIYYTYFYLFIFICIYFALQGIKSMVLYVLGQWATFPSGKLIIFKSFEYKMRGSFDLPSIINLNCIFISYLKSFKVSSKCVLDKHLKASVKDHY